MNKTCQNILKLILILLNNPFIFMEQVLIRETIAKIQFFLLLLEN